MANIGSQPSAGLILSEGRTSGDYGDRLVFEREGDDKVHLLTREGTLIATASEEAAFVHTEELEPLLVPYVNAFIEHTKQRVEKYWRTKQYRVVDIERPSLNGSSDPAIHARAAQALNLLAPRKVSDAEQMRSLAQLLLRGAEALEILEKQRIAEAQAQLSKEPKTVKAG